jgi:hypothetical protein
MPGRWENLQPHEKSVNGDLKSSVSFLMLLMTSLIAYSIL